MKIPKADSNPGVELRYNTSLPTDLLSSMRNLHSYRVYSDIVIGYLVTHQATKLYAQFTYAVYSDIAFGWLIGFNTERGKEYFIRNK